VISAARVETDSGYPSPKNRVVIVEDEAWFREDLAELLRENEYLVVAVCGGVAEARAVLATTSVDLAVIDCRLPDGNGLDLARELTATRPELRVVMLTVLDQREPTLAALHAGVQGYVLKSAGPEKILEALSDVAAGRVALSSGVLGHVVAEVRSATSLESNGLSPREREILSLLARGLTYRAIADALRLAEGTVQTHVKHIYTKLDVSSKAEATAIAVRLGLA
jgi:two-component system response regulator DevR